MKNISKTHIAKDRFRTIHKNGFEWQCFFTAVHPLAQLIAVQCRAKGIAVEILTIPTTGDNSIFVVAANCPLYRFRHVVRCVYNRVQKSRKNWQEQQRLGVTV
ncbi:MAG TPA: hypothetical protein VGB77_07230 [Abditibacteriaceae bacterium]|jgi:hypothetical protein